MMFLYVYDDDSRKMCVEAGFRQVAMYEYITVFVNDGRAIPDGVKYTTTNTLTL